MEGDSYPEAEIEDLLEDEIAPEDHRLARRVFVSIISQVDLADPDIKFKDLIDKLDERARGSLEFNSKSEASAKAALAKMHGDWFEWLLCNIAQQSNLTPGLPIVAIKLPNVVQFDSTNLYVEELRTMIGSLRTEVRKSSVELISSNPDFVLVQRELVDLLPPAGLDATELLVNWHERRYLPLAGRCTFESIYGYLAAKYTLRPDRRLQIAHESSLMKALYVHLQTRLWNTTPRGLRFHAVSTRVGNKDRAALKTVATHSITTVGSVPQAAVDTLHETKSVGDAQSMFRKILAS